jgi:hypothetical protein
MSEIQNICSGKKVSEISLGSLEMEDIPLVQVAILIEQTKQLTSIADSLKAIANPCQDCCKKAGEQIKKENG